MLEYTSYILFFSLIIILVSYIYVHLKYGFWMLQPVFHIYNLSYMVFPPGIINEHLPLKNKYTNFKDIYTISFASLSELNALKFAKFIQNNYLQNDDNIFSPKLENISCYFNQHNDTSFISFYYKDNKLLDLKTNKIIDDKEIIGAITSRPLNVYINNDHKNKNSQLRVYYVDYLCVKKTQRKKGIAPQLIQTHHYNQSHQNKKIVVSIFKREDELTGIVPLCVYDTFGFSVSKWDKPHELSGEYKLLEINTQNFRFLYDFIKIHSEKFDIVIYPDISNIIELIKSKNIYVYSVLCDEKIICCYFYRKSCVQIEKGLEVLSCFASISNCDDAIFIQGFKISFWKIANENYFGFCAIENISNNNIIIDNIKEKTSPTIISPTAYFFYNFAYPTFNNNKSLIIN